MQMSCNGCRVLRKGCSEECSMRPCLDWIQNPDSQGHATLFLAKFYGRTGLVNLLNAGPQHLRPAIFRSLLYEACGRVVDPIQGSVGLLWSGSWQLCQNAVDAVLCGTPINQTVATDSYSGPPDFGNNGVSDHDMVLRARTSRFKRSAKIRQSRALQAGNTKRSLSSTGHQSEVALAEKKEEEEVELDLMLGFEPSKGCGGVKKPDKLANGGDSGLCRMELGLDYPGLSFL